MWPAVFSETEFTPEVLASFPVQEIVFAMPDVDIEHKQQLYAMYKEFRMKCPVNAKSAGCTRENTVGGETCHRIARRY